MKQVVYKLAEWLSFVLLTPLLLWSVLPVMSENSRFTAPSQILALIPGKIGIVLRRVWYLRTLNRCGRSLVVEWLGVIRVRQSEIGNNCTIGVANWIGWVTMGDDIMTGSHVIVLSGRHQHGFTNMEVPMRHQDGEKRQLRIHSNVWVGSASVIMEDVSEGTIVGAGSVVTKTYKPNSVIAGNPARIIKSRLEQ